MPRVPKVKPKAPSKYVLCSEALQKVTPFEISFETFFDLTFGKCHLSRVPSVKPPLPDTFRARRVSPNTPSRENPSGCRPSSPSVPECLKRKPPPGALRASHVSRDSPRENPGCFPKAPPVPSTGRPPGSLRVCHVPRA